MTITSFKEENKPHNTQDCIRQVSVSQLQEMRAHVQNTYLSYLCDLMHPCHIITWSIIIINLTPCQRICRLLMSNPKHSEQCIRFVILTSRARTEMCIVVCLLSSHSADTMGHFHSYPDCSKDPAQYWRLAPTQPAKFDNTHVAMSYKPPFSPSLFNRRDRR